MCHLLDGSVKAAFLVYYSAKQNLVEDVKFLLFVKFRWIS